MFITLLVYPIYKLFDFSYSSRRFLAKDNSIKNSLFIVKWMTMSKEERKAIFTIDIKRSMMKKRSLLKEIQREYKENISMKKDSSN